jgi:hypothetical protein
MMLLIFNKRRLCFFHTLHLSPGRYSYNIYIYIYTHTHARAPPTPHLYSEYVNSQICIVAGHQMYNIYPNMELGFIYFNLMKMAYINFTKEENITEIK